MQVGLAAADRLGPSRSVPRDLFLDRARDFVDDSVEGLKHYLDTVADKERECSQRQGHPFELDRLAVCPEHAEEAAKDRTQQHSQRPVQAVPGNKGWVRTRRSRSR